MLSCRFYNVREIFNCQQDAERNAIGTLLKLQRTGYELYIKMCGDSLFEAESHIKVQGFKTALPELWTIKNITHRLNANGYFVEMNLQPIIK